MFEIIKKITVNCTDNTRYFIVDDRIKVIKSLLSKTSYKLVYDGELVKIYGKNEIKGDVKIISSHIDCVEYDSFFVIDNGEYYEGIFDNALTNAIVIQAMIEDKFKADVFIAFTGSEEKGDFGGAREVVRFANEKGIKIMKVIVTDATFENYDTCGVSYENFYNQSNDFENIMLNKIQIPVEEVSFVKDACPDEAHKYKQLGISTYSLCIPTASLSDDYEDMHANDGLRVKKTSVDIYYKALVLSV